MKDFKIGQLVWAKVKYFPPWPARVIELPRDLRSKKNCEFVFFFGSNDYKFVEKKNLQDYFEKDLSKIKYKNSDFQEACKDVLRFIRGSNYTFPTGGMRRDTILKTRNNRKVSLKKRVQEKAGKQTSPDPMVNYSLTQEEEGRPEVQQTLGCSQRNELEVTQKEMMITSDSQSNECDPTVLATPGCSHWSDELKSTQDVLMITSDKQTNKYHHTVPATPGCSHWRDELKSTEVEPMITSESQPNESDTSVVCPPLTIAFIGSGEISSILVGRLQAAGHTVSTWDQHSARVCDIVRSSELIFSYQPDKGTARRIIFEEGGVVEGISPGKRFVEMSNTDSKTASEVATAVRQKGGQFLEVVMVGSREKLKVGSAGLLCGGDYLIMKECRHGLQAIAKTVEFVGPAGMAAQIALILRVSQGGMVAALAEAASVLEAEGLVNMEMFTNVLRCTWVDSPLVMHAMDCIDHNDYSTPLLKLEDLWEDLTSMPAMASQVHRTMPLTNLFTDICTRAMRNGNRKEDLSVIFKCFKP